MARMSRDPMDFAGQVSTLSEYSSVSSAASPIACVSQTPPINGLSFVVHKWRHAYSVYGYRRKSLHQCDLCNPLRPSVPFLKSLIKQYLRSNQ
jgi:hypothetical protein